MGNSVFRSGGLLLSVNRENTVSESTIKNIETLSDVLRANPKIPIQRLETLLQQIPKVRIMNFEEIPEDILILLFCYCSMKIS